MIRAFIDASVLFAATYSPRSSARDLITLGLVHKLQLVISPHVSTEVERNLSEKYPERLATLTNYSKVLTLKKLTDPVAKKSCKQRLTPPSRTRPSSRQQSNQHVPIWSRMIGKHLLDRPEVAEHSGLNILTPADLLNEFNTSES